jgi:hypothetical protein
MSQARKNKDQLAAWQIEREQGVVKFCLKKGVLLWGMLLFFSAFMGRHVVDAVLYDVDIDRLLFDVRLGLPISIILGFVFGYFLWRKNEKYYRDSLKYMK